MKQVKWITKSGHGYLMLIRNNVGTQIALFITDNSKYDLKYRCNIGIKRQSQIIKLFELTDEEVMQHIILEQV